jgi:serine/threonine-protein kinase
MVGRKIGGRYTLARKIGSGGMGTVYLAADAVRVRDVAVKFLAPHLAVDRTSRERFLREAKAANRIEHENIIDITDYGETEDGLAYLVMEYLDGVGLNEEIAEGPLPLDRALRIALQMCDALARAHELGVIHRDIKPDNVFLLHGYDGDFVKLLDFGLAKVKGDMRLTATGVVFGTPEYIAPEQARGAPATASVDLYALGCVLYEMLSGQLPFSGTTPDLIVKHMRAVPDPPSSRGTALPASVDAFVLKLLSKQPEERPATAYAAAGELRQILESVAGIGRLPKRTREPSSTTVVHMGFSAEDAWEQRIDTFRALVFRAHPDGNIPAWLVPAIDDLGRRVERMRVHRRELQDWGDRIARREQDVSDARLRIGRALDELGRDESRVLGELDDILPRVVDARQRLSELEKPLLRSWGAIPPLPVPTPPVTRDIVETLREAGHLASIWIEAQRLVATLERDLQAAERARDDLRFQISQLKGRFGSLNAEGESDLAVLRQRSAESDDHLQEEVEETMRGAAPVYQHFLQFPHLRDHVLSGQPAA